MIGAIYASDRTTGSAMSVIVKKAEKIKAD